MYCWHVLPDTIIDPATQEPVKTHRVIWNLSYTTRRITKPIVWGTLEACTEYIRRQVPKRRNNLVIVDNDYNLIPFVR
jgi:hypothetical protein